MKHEIEVPDDLVTACAAMGVEWKQPVVNAVKQALEGAVAQARDRALQANAKAVEALRTSTSPTTIQGAIEAIQAFAKIAGAKS